jgi:hypothetical protein
MSKGGGGISKCKPNVTAAVSTVQLCAVDGGDLIRASAASNAGRLSQVMQFQHR